jgi:putative transposase
VKIRDRGAASDDDRVRFSSSILPKWARRTRSLDPLLPILYLRGVSRRLRRSSVETHRTCRLQ